MVSMIQVALAVMSMEQTANWAKGERSLKTYFPKFQIMVPTDELPDQNGSSPQEAVGPRAAPEKTV